MVQKDQQNNYRLHTSYHQTGAQTGRMSSNDPNLQNIPIRSEEGRSIRKAFIAPKGYKLLAADYSQIELRIMTHLSQDPNLVAAFKEGKDIHRATAADVMSIPESEVTSEQRRSAKAINFGLIYGMSAFGLAKQIGISRTEAKQYVDAYFERYPGVKRYMDETQAEAAETGYVETIFGRRLYLPGIQSSNQIVRKGAERTAINAPMQGTAADVIKMAMVDVQKWLESSNLRAQMIMQVHDELVFEVHEDDVAAVTEGVRFRMQHCAQLDVPLIVDIGIGDNWDEAH
jgi:DNA polymerase-1